MGSKSSQSVQLCEKRAHSSALAAEITLLLASLCSSPIAPAASLAALTYLHTHSVHMKCVPAHAIPSVDCTLSQQIAHALRSISATSSSSVLVDGRCYRLYVKQLCRIRVKGDAGGRGAGPLHCVSTSVMICAIGTLAKGAAPLTMWNRHLQPEVCLACHTSELLWVEHFRLHVVEGASDACGLHSVQRVRHGARDADLEVAS